MKRMCIALLGGLWLLAGGAGAQAPAGSRAQVATVTGMGKAAQFSVPQVRLPATTVAERINRTIARVLLSYAAEPVDTTATLARQLKAVAAQPCCLHGVHYQVLLNQGFLLSLKLTLEFSGASAYERTSHLVFDLRTGRRPALTELLADAPTQLQEKLESAVNKRIGEFLADTEKRGPAETAALAERFRWDAAARRVRFGPSASTATAERPSLHEFALTPNALLLFYRVGPPATLLADTPAEAYRFPYAKLQPIGLLAELSHRP